MTRILTALSFFSLLTVTAPANAQDVPQTVAALDISGSVTFVAEQLSADAAGAYLQDYIAALAPPHKLALISVGDPGMAHRVIDIRATVTQSRASSGKKLAPQFGGYVRALPGLVKSGKIVPQNSTSLIGFFKSMEPVCAAGNGTVILFSDGLESSRTVDGRAFAEGKAGLPKPGAKFLTGCQVKLLGVGQVKSALDGDGLAERLIPQWRAYLTEAGASPVTVIGSGFSF